jgi:hypothetical protein
MIKKLTGPYTIPYEQQALKLYSLTEGLSPLYAVVTDALKVVQYQEIV